MLADSSATVETTYQRVVALEDAGLEGWKKVKETVCLYFVLFILVPYVLFTPSHHRPVKCILSVFRMSICGCASHGKLLFRGHIVHTRPYAEYNFWYLQSLFILQEDCVVFSRPSDDFAGYM